MILLVCYNGRAKMNIKPYIFAGLIGISVFKGCKEGKPVMEPQLINGPKRISYRLDDEMNQRYFLDEIPFGSLDKVIIHERTANGWKRKEFYPGDSTFQQLEKVFKAKIRPMYIEE